VAQAEAYATQRPRVALLFGSVSRHLPAGLTRIARFSIVLSAILMLALPAARTASFAPTDRTIIKVASFAELAQQLAASLNKCWVKRIVIVDFEDPIRRVDAFGVWLADQLAAAPGNPWTPIEVVDRKQIAAKWEELRIAEPYTIEPDRVLHLAKAFDATLIGGSYSPAENGIGLELSAAASAMPNGLIVKLAMTDEMKAHLTKPLESLGPGDGIFTAGVGGISIPRCAYCPIPSFAVGALNGQSAGTVLLMIVVDANGRASDITVKIGVTPELNQDAINAVKRWNFKPATDVDGKPVATHVTAEIDFRGR
jgi:TonB family protein